jgi:lipoprotein LprG
VLPRARPPAVVLPAALLTALLAATGCTADDDGDADSADDLGSRMEAARAVLDDAASIDLVLSTDALPDGIEGLVAADGTGNHDPAFEGTVTIVSGAFGDIDADVVAVDGDVYAELPFTGGFAPIDPSDYGAPDPAALLASDGGVSEWLTSADDLSDGGESRDGDDVLTSIEGTLPGDVVDALIPSADGDAEFEVVFRLTDDDELRDASVAGPFYPGGEDVTYELVVEPSDDDVEITAP